MFTPRLLMPPIPIDDALIDAATEELREVVKKMFFTVDVVSGKTDPTIE